MDNNDFDPETFLWIHSGPSRRLRKLYAQAAAVERRMDAVRNSNPFPEHAPTACRIRGRQLRELRDEHDRLLRRIARVEPED